MRVARSLTLMIAVCVILATGTCGVSRSSDISSDEQVVFFPTCAHLDKTGKTWIVPIRGVIYEPEGNSRRRDAMVKAISNSLAVEDDTPQSERLDRRVRLFLVDNEGGQDISVRIAGEVFEVGTSRDDGRFEGSVRIAVAQVTQLLGDPAGGNQFLPFEAVTRESDRRRFVGSVQLIGRQGLSIISDIDDTIKHTQVSDHRAVLANTFLNKFKAVPGMPELYRDCAVKGMVFHYVSGSPTQLYLPLAEFLDAEDLPRGSFDLKAFDLTSLSSTLGMLQSQKPNKLRAIRQIMSAYPERRFILIGDSGEEDPEVYREVALSNADQVVAIFIRNVSEEEIDNERFGKATKNLDDVRIRLFDDPVELRAIIEAIDAERP